MSESSRDRRPDLNPRVVRRPCLTIRWALGLSQVEFIVMGGTFMSLDEDYKDWFIRNLHDALSGHCSSR